ncbi:MAG TPA: CPBP family intramembrane glutamic endopeptidase [Vicinamibacterales bacterium]
MAGRPPSLAATSDSSGHGSRRCTGSACSLTPRFDLEGPSLSVRQGVQPSVHSDSAGARLLIYTLLLEALRVALNATDLPISIRAPLYLSLALLAVHRGAGVAWSEIGFRRWRDWNRTEKSYFVQIVIIANVIFGSVFAAGLKAQLGGPDAASVIWLVFVPLLFLGFYQEVIYRGMLQTELVRRCGPAAGLLIANVLYTFSPGHYDYFSSPRAVAVPMFAAIFAMGLVFAMIYRKSGNLWIVAVMHALGNAYIVTGGQRFH